MGVNKYPAVLNEEEHCCPECGMLYNLNVDIGGEYLYDICPGCGTKGKRPGTGKW